MLCILLVSFPKRRLHNGVLTGTVRLQRDNEMHKLVFSADMYGNSMQFEPVGVKVTYIQYESPAEQLQCEQGLLSTALALDRRRGLQLECHTTRGFAAS